MALVHSLGASSSVHSQPGGLGVVTVAKCPHPLSQEDDKGYVLIDLFSFIVAVLV